MTTATLTEPVEAPEADTTPAPSADTAAPEVPVSEAAADPAAPSAEPTAEPADWTPRGAWNVRDGAPLVLGYDGAAGAFTLTLKFQSPPDAREAIAGPARELPAQTRALVLEMLATTPEVARLKEVRPLLKAASAAHQEAVEHLQALELRRAALSQVSPLPAGWVEQVVGLDEEIAAGVLTKQRKAAAVEALRPLHQQALQALATLVPQVIQQVRQRHWQERQQALVEAVEAFAREHSQALTELATTAKVRSATPLGENDADAIARQVIEGDDPAPEPAGE